jgi:hypothetical protein
MPLPRGFIGRSAEAGLRASAEALFPENDYGAPDFRATDLVGRTIEYLDALPAEQRRLIVLLFAFVELGALFLVFGFRRFSRIPVARREAIVRAWRRSRLLPLRLLGDALKATTTMIYMSHPAALAYVGVYSACERPGDALRVEVRRGVFSKGEAGL